MFIVFSNSESIRLVRALRSEGSFVLAEPKRLPAGYEIGQPTPEDMDKLLSGCFGLERRLRIGCLRACDWQPERHASYAGRLAELLLAGGTLPHMPGSREEAHLLVASPAQLSLERARTLAALSKAGKISCVEAVILETSFQMELCGRFSRAFDEPQTGECAYDIEPLSDSLSLRSSLMRCKGAHGSRLALQAVRLVHDGAGSPPEVLLMLALMLPPKYGGIHMRDALANQPLEIPDDLRGGMRHKQIRPDLYWPAYRLALEYDGSVHATTRGMREDKSRMQDYVTCGITALPVTYQDICSPAALSRLLGLVLDQVTPYESADYMRTRRRHLISSCESGMMGALIRHLLPPRAR
ncbi:MAG: hypothetical protein LKG38_03840 [Atopobiaceae bacterium]|jgi:hypothetical protein|nr:hypothetical protein [Atopobiaceae bacterium]MCH4119765.1 hypothetical protein [Atopobiaceae bacterium]MCI1318458.1 hypothetical protein [Atopobiaceae bacterium]MCI1388839.1 hypothetical protein [Atopobiaceae bacterium]MCI1432541.1 hypothetical protein [Atopobiaceae bacterium]